MEKREGGVSRAKKWHCRRDGIQLTLASVADGRQLQAKEMGQPLQAGKDKEDSPLELLEGTQPCQHPDFYPLRLIWDF